MPSAALSRADLLRVLPQYDTATLERLAHLCGFERQLEASFTLTLLAAGRDEDASGATGDRVSEEAASTPQSSVALASIRPPLRARLFTAWLTENPVEPEENRPALAPLPVEALLPAPGATPPPKVPLVRAAQLWPALKQSLSFGVPGELDLKALVEQLARTQQCEPWPSVQSSGWRSPLWVIWDCAERLTPYYSDYQALLRQLCRLRGDAGLVLYTRYDDGGYKRWSSVRARPSESNELSLGRGLKRLPRPAEGTALLLLSDLGALARSIAAEQRWLQQLRAWRRSGLEVLAWLPSAPGQVHADIARASAIHHLCEQGRLQPQRRGWRSSQQRDATQDRLRDRLLQLGSCALHVAPELLRALRLLDPALRHEPGAEALTWDAEQVGRSPLSRPLRPEHVSEYRARFRGLPLTLQQAVQCCLQEQHIARGRTTVWLEHLLWQVHSDPAAPTPDCIALGEHARLALQILVEAGAGSSLQADVERFARDVWQRQQHDETWWRTQGDWAVPLLRRAGIEEAPKGMAPKFAWQLQPQSLEYRCYLAQRGDALWVIPAGEAVPAGQRLTPDFSSDRILMEQASVEITPGERIAISAPWLPLGAEAQEILKSLHSVNLQTRSARIEIAEVPRPRWAVEFGRDSRGVYAVGAPLGSHVIRLDALPLDQWQSGDAFLTADFAPRVIHRTPRAELSLGIDREFGNYAELQIDHVVQRLRWIPAGEFLMGSPDDEPERFDDEGPQHRVRITEGFWLSDTACTQALWLAVMGTNPSYFSGNPENPVEQVSFDDVEIFLAKLRAQLPEGVRVELPTEAQWEYACRAGSITAFSFGATVSPAQVNYDGNHPYADAAKGEYRQRTVPVRSLPANAWGLYEMHGNVFEWCRDGCRGYGTVQPGSAEQDPVGPLAPASCALRGGAWIFSARLARSAYRLRYERGDRYHDVGFRWSLRSLRSLSPAARSAGFSGSGRVAGAHAPAVSGPEGRLSLEPEALPSSPGNNEK